MDMNFSKLEKLKITAYNNEQKETLIGKCELMFNPESYTVSYQNYYAKKQALGADGSTGSFAGSKDVSISFKFIFDGTGVSEFAAVSPAKDVYKEVQRFIGLMATINGEGHQPNYLKLVWGDLNFRCKLETLQISYTLLDHTGKPLRAELDTTFVGFLKRAKRLKGLDLKSPDLTRKRLVKAFDTLPLLCEEVYGSGRYYLQVAKANGLDNFRNLVPGQQLYFPPIEK